MNDRAVAADVSGDDPEDGRGPAGPHHGAADGAADDSGAAVLAADPHHDLGVPGPAFDRRAPYLFGLLLGLGLLTAYAIGTVVQTMSGVIIQVVVALFIAAGVNPMVSSLERRGLRRAWAVLVVMLGVLGAVALFVVALVPVISEQVRRITAHVPGWIDQLQNSPTIQNFNDRYKVLDRVQEFVTNGDFVSSLFGGALGVGLAVLGVILNAFIVIVLTLYFIASYGTTKRAIYQLAPASRRDRVTKLGDRIFEGIGGYVSGAFIVALCAGLSTLVMLFVVGMGDYAVALAFVVMITDVIPMIGATIGAVIVSAIAFATDIKTGIICAIFFLIYQQVENYLVYPRVMAKAVDVPGIVTVIAALVGASLLGVLGALLAIPTAAAVLMLVREVFVRAQDER